MSLIVVPVGENKDTLKKYEELWTKIKDLIRSKTNNSDNYDESYMKTKFNSDDGLFLGKSLKLSNMIIVVRAVFREGNENYPQELLHKCSYKL